MELILELAETKFMDKDIFIEQGHDGLGSRKLLIENILFTAGTHSRAWTKRNFVS